MIRSTVEPGRAAPPSFTEVVDNVRNETPEGLDQLNGVFGTLSSSLRRQIGRQDFEDYEHDIFIAVVEAIHEGRLRNSNALASYIHGIAHLQRCAEITAHSRHRRLSNGLLYWISMRNNNNTPEDALAKRERSGILKILLGSLSPRERDILIRFYLREQSKEQICDEMSLTATQFRLAKCRAKQHLSRLAADSRTSVEPPNVL